MKENIKNILQAIDIFSYRINFSYEGKKAYNSFYSMTLSIFAYLVMIIYCFHFSKDFIKRSNPKIDFLELELPFWTNKVDFNLLFNDISFTSILELKKNLFNNSLLINNSIPNIFFNITLKASKNLEYDKTIYSTADISQIIKITPLENIYNSSSITPDNSTQQIFYYNVTMTKPDKLSINHYSLFHSDSKYPLIELNKNNQTFVEVGANNLIELSLQFLKNNITKHIVSNFIKLLVNLNSDAVAFEFGENQYRTNSFNSGTIENYLFHTADQSLTRRVFKAVYESIHVYESQNNFFSFEEDEGIIKYRISDLTNSKITTFLAKDFYPILEIKYQRLIKKYLILFKDLKTVLSEIGGLFSAFILIGNILITFFNKNKFEYDLINYLFKKDLSEEQVFELFQLYKIKKYMNQSKYNKESIFKPSSIFKMNPNLNANSDTDKSHMIDVKDKDFSELAERHNPIDNYSINNKTELPQLNIINTSNNINCHTGSSNTGLEGEYNISIPIPKRFKKESMLEKKLIEHVHKIKKVNKNTLNKLFLNNEQRKSKDDNISNYFQNNHPTSKSQEKENNQMTLIHKSKKSYFENNINQNIKIELKNQSRMSNIDTDRTNISMSNDNSNNTHSFKKNLIDSNSLISINRKKRDSDLSEEEKNINNGSSHKFMINGVNESSFKEKLNFYLHRHNKNRGLEKFVKFKHFEFLKSMFFCKACKSPSLLEREEIFNRIKSKIRKYLDVNNLLYLYEEFEKLKKIMLNDNQITAMQFFKKDEILDVYNEDRIADCIAYFIERDKSLACDGKDQKIITMMNGWYRFISED